MNREQMLKDLKKGIHPIDVTIQKWVDIQNTTSVNRRSARHQFDEGQSNCALCYIHIDCKECPAFLKYKIKCDSSKDENDKKYKKDFYAQYRDTGDAQIIINMLKNIKKKMFWVLLKYRVKQIFIRFIERIKIIIQKRSKLKTSALSDNP